MAQELEVENGVIEETELKAAFPELFETFPALGVDRIYNELLKWEFDPEVTMQHLKSSTKGKGMATLKRTFTPTLEESVNDLLFKEDSPVASGHASSSTASHALSSKAANTDFVDINSLTPEMLIYLIVEWSNVESILIDEHEALSTEETAASSEEVTTANEPKAKRRRVTNIVEIPTKIAKVYHEFTADEVTESETLVLQEEENSDDAEQQESEKPCRTLDDFVIYDMSQKNLLTSLDSINDEDCELRAYGVCSACFAPDADEDAEGIVPEEMEELSQINLATTTLFSLEITWETDGNPGIWVLTQFSWYKLLKPSKAYAPFYETILKKARIVNGLITGIMLDPTASLSALVERVISFWKANDDPLVHQVEIAQSDIALYANYIIEEFQYYGEENKINIVKSGFWTELKALAKPKGKSGKRSTVRAAPRVSKNNIDLAVLQERNLSTITPWIASISQDLFRCNMTIAGAVSGAPSSKKPVVAANGLIQFNDDSYLPPKVVKTQTSEVHWLSGPCSEIVDKAGIKTCYYNEISVDGQVIKKHDIVFIRTYTEFVWFGKICHMSQISNSLDLMVHVQYYEHASRTILQEVAASREVFLCGDCGDLNAHSIIGKCDLIYVPQGKPEPTHAELGEKFFYRYFWYGKEDIRFDDIESHVRGVQDDSKWNYCLSEERCDNCENVQERNRTLQPRCIVDPKNSVVGFEYRGQSYHVGDFVYLINNDPQSPYKIGYITSFANKTLAINGVAQKSQAQENEEFRFYVQLLGRCDDLLLRKASSVVDSDGNLTSFDSRKLYLIGRTRLYSPEHVDGKCVVKHISQITNLDAYRDLKDSFFYSQSRAVKDGKMALSLIDAPLQACTICGVKQTKKEQDLVQFRAEVKPLIGLDIFAGCGGLTAGLDRGGFVDTKYCVEFSPSACLTFKKNFPGATVYNQCANVLLQRAIEVHQEGKKLSPALDLQDQTLSDMPKPGQVDFIYGGPPCQGFSGINRFKRANDVKNSLVSCLLSYADFYRPKYFLLENVRGMLVFRLGGEQDGTNKIVGGIKMGAVKFILRALTSMNYQCSLTMKQAGHFGVSQSRRRVIFIGVQRGCALNTSPMPSHCFPKSESLTVNVDYNDETVQYDFNRRSKGNAPEKFVSVWDVTSDLPAFEYKNPHGVYDETDVEKAEAKERVKSIEVFNVSNAAKARVGYEKKAYLALEPLSQFQRQMRIGVAAGTPVSQHQTRGFKNESVERICQISLKPGSDHHSLPEKLKPWCLSHADSAASRHGGWKGLFGRLDNDSHFPTALTAIEPMGKQGSVIHPTQKRVVTVRECARVQGFPDTFKFHSIKNDIKDMHRQIGNAVPPPLADAIGRSLVEAWFEQWRKQQ